MSNPYLEALLGSNLGDDYEEEFVDFDDDFGGDVNAWNPFGKFDEEDLQDMGDEAAEEFLNKRALAIGFWSGIFGAAAVPAIMKSRQSIDLQYQAQESPLSQVLGEQLFYQTPGYIEKLKEHKVMVGGTFVSLYYLLYMYAKRNLNEKYGE